VGYSLSKAARQDVIDIYLQSEDRFGEAQADRYLAGLFGAFAFLADNPRAARERREFDPPVRIHPYKGASRRLRARG
jgi:toxin ParE1/3/4